MLLCDFKQASIKQRTRWTRTGTPTSHPVQKVSEWKISLDMDHIWLSCPIRDRNQTVRPTGLISCSMERGSTVSLVLKPGSLCGLNSNMFNVSILTERVDPVTMQDGAIYVLRCLPFITLLLGVCYLNREPKRRPKPKPGEFPEDQVDECTGNRRDHWMTALLMNVLALWDHSADLVISS